MNLYKITTRFLGKDLDERAILAYVIAETDAEVADYINQAFGYGEWFECSPLFRDDVEPSEAIRQVREDYVAHQGDNHTGFAGEFFDQKYEWEDLGEVTDDQIAVLTGLNVASVIAN